MRRTLMVTLLAAATTVVMVACSSAGPSGTAPATIVQGAPAGTGASSGGGGGAGGSAVSDPCVLLTQAEVAAVVGKSVGPGSSADNPNSCDFQYPADGFPDVQAGVDFIDGSLADFCTEGGASAVGLTIEPVDGLGDGACFIHVGSLQVGSALTFSKNGRLFQTFALLGSTASIADIKAADTALAQVALTRL